MVTIICIPSIHLELCRFCHCPLCSGPPPCRCPRSPSRCSPAQRAWWPGARPRTPHRGTPRAWNQVRNMEQGNRVWVASMSTTNGSCLLNQLFHFHKSFQSKIFFLSLISLHKGLYYTLLLLGVVASHLKSDMCLMELWGICSVDSVTKRVIPAFTI